jgi:uncharacterized protein (DUF362 family)
MYPVLGDSAIWHTMFSAECRYPVIYYSRERNHHAPRTRGPAALSKEESVDRREFLRSLAGLGAAGAAFFMNRGRGLLWAEDGAKARAGTIPDLVAVKGGAAEAMFDIAIKEYGGMGAFVRKGQTVVVKPNIGWDQGPEMAANTNPALVKRIVEHCLDAGAKKVYVFDHSCDSGSRSYKNSQIERYAKDGGAEVVTGDSSSLYHDTAIAGAATLKKAMVHELILESDVFINVPVLKNHSGAGMTCAMKNFMGIVWDRGAFHARGLDACIADSCLIRRPALNVVDAWKVMLSGGPRGYAGSRFDEQKMLMLSTDIVAIDAASAATMGKKAADFGYIGKGEERGLGRADLKGLNILRLNA